MGPRLDQPRASLRRDRLLPIDAKPPGSARDYGGPVRLLSWAAGMRAGRVQHRRLWLGKCTYCLGMLEGQLPERVPERVPCVVRRRWSFEGLGCGWWFSWRGHGSRDRPGALGGLARALLGRYAWGCVMEQDGAGGDPNSTL
ncbi:MAG: hypothetical protein KatS3mg103_1069 [Phycisphaerales bacterium]|nr:MAG: hypothetical protein KatS3mg103_1069 [Phycisphaerales bacterium]